MEHETNQPDIIQENLQESYQIAQNCVKWIQTMERVTPSQTQNKEDALLLRRAITKLNNKIITEWRSLPSPLSHLSPLEVLTHLNSSEWSKPLGTEHFSLEPHICDNFIRIIRTISISMPSNIEEISALFSSAILNVAHNSNKRPSTIFGETTRKMRPMSEKHLDKAILMATRPEKETPSKKRKRKKASKEGKSKTATAEFISKEATKQAILHTLDAFAQEAERRLSQMSQNEMKQLMAILHGEFLHRSKESAHTLLLQKPKSREACFEAIGKIGKKDFYIPSRAFATYRNHLPSMGAYTDNVAEFATLYGKDLEKSARMTLEEMARSGYDKTPEEIIAAPYFQAKQYFSHGLLGLYIRHGIPSDIQEKLIDLIPLDPKDEYPRARELTRHFIIHVGGTNTGKTYQGLQRLKSAKTGVYLSPLRLLALEIQETLGNAQVSCGLLTGEEEDLSESNTHMASTVEKLNLYAHYEVAVLDECQMIADANRGFAWTRAILGCLSPEIHCCVAPEGLEILIKTIQHCGDSYEIEEHQRKVPLTYQEKPVPLSKAQKGDAFVAFSRKTVLLLAQKLTALGFSVSVIYGALPYKARRAQMEQFLSGETQILVATDAIGMGLNLPVRRVIFTADEKYDGNETRGLLPNEVKQIGGRAGRFGKYDEGFVCRVHEDLDIEMSLKDPTPLLKTARLGFSELILSLDFDIVDILKVWQALPDKPPFVKMDIDRYLDIINRLRSHDIDLSKSDLLKASIIPFDENSNILWAQFMSYIINYTQEEAIEFPMLYSPRLQDLEIYMKKLELFYSFSKNFNYPLELDAIAEEKERTTRLINDSLITLRNSSEKTKQKKTHHFDH